MTGSKHILLLILGMSAVSLAASVPALAQTAAERNSQRPAGLSFPDDVSRATRGGGGPAQDADGSSAAGDLNTASDDADAPQDEDSTEPRPAAGQRAAVKDGDLSSPAEPSAPIDGVIDAPEPEAPQDGADPVAIDMRDPEDRAVFDGPIENPPAGYDPLLFQIEEVEPILDRRPERLFNFEPYDPAGIKLGSFIYFPETGIAGAHFNNVFSSPKPLSDNALELKTLSRLVSNWKTHALELRSISNWSFHDEFPTENDKEYRLEARGRLDVTRRTNLQGLISHERTQESRSAIDASTVGDRPDVDTNTAAATLIHRFNRLEGRVRAEVTDEDFSNPSDGFGGIENNDDRDRRMHEQAVRLTYELKPSLAVFAETELNQREYKVAAFSDGLLRNSNGQRYRLGLDFGETGMILRGELSIGYGVQKPDTSALDEVDGFLFDANVAWRVTDMTSLLLTGRTDITDTTTAGSGGVLNHQVGLEVRQAFKRYFIGTAGVSYSTNDFGAVGTKENTLEFTAGAEYFVNREIILFSRYLHTDFNSSEPFSDWDSDEIRVGLRLRK